MNRAVRVIPVILGCAAILLLADELLACSVCFGGDPNSPMNQGAKAGILILLGVVGTVLFSIAGVALFWVRRARLLDEAVNPAGLGQRTFSVRLAQTNGRIPAAEGSN